MSSIREYTLLLMARTYLVSILVSSMAHWFNLSVPADVHWIEYEFYP